MTQTLFNFHNLLQIRLDAPPGTFRDYFEVEFAHGSRQTGSSADPDIPTIHLLLDVPLPVNGAVWALGKGLFFNQDTQDVLVGRDRDTSHFDPDQIYASLTNPLDSGVNSLSVRLKPDALLQNDWESVLRDLFRRFVKKDPRSKARQSAESFASQFIEPNLYRLFLRSGHLLLHAAGLEQDGEGILVFGPQNIGKTTITLHLCNNGWRMLGDDMCLIEEPALMRSYAKPLKLERELLESSPQAHTAAKQAEKRDPALSTFRPRLRRSGAGFEIKVAPDALGIDTVDSVDARAAFFLTRGANVAPGKVSVEPISAEEAAALCEQHIAAEYDGNKHLDRDIRQNLALHLRTAGTWSVITPQVSGIVRSSFANLNSYLVTMSQPDTDVMHAIQRTVDSLRAS